MTTNPASCPPARVRVPLYMAANVLPDGRVCVWDGVGQVTVDGKRPGLQRRVNEAAQSLDGARAEKINQAARELR